MGSVPGRGNQSLMWAGAGSARATALMVKLGLTNLVRDIVVKLSHMDRSDVVAQVSAGPADRHIDRPNVSRLSQGHNV